MCFNTTRLLVDTKHKGLIYKKVDATYDDDLVDDITVKASSGAIIVIGNISNYELKIEGEYTVDIPQKENIYNVPPIEETQENTCRVPNCKTCS